MRRGTTYRANWSGTLKFTTACCCVLCLGIILMGVFDFPITKPNARLMMVIGPVIALLAGAAFIIRSYTIKERELVVHRLGWRSRVDLSHLKSASYDPWAMRHSIRVAGNGGFFAFCGHYRSPRLGNYRAFATDPKHAVVLRFPDRIVVVTPDDPQKFIREVTNH